MTELRKIEYNKNSGERIKCEECGKMVAYLKDGRIYVMCKNCKQQIDILNYLEPRA